MKRIFLGAAFALVAGTAMAGTPAAPMVEPEVMVQQAAGSSVTDSVLPPLIFLMAIGMGMLM